MVGYVSQLRQLLLARLTVATIKLNGDFKAALLFQILTIIFIAIPKLIQVIIFILIYPMVVNITQIISLMTTFK